MTPLAIAEVASSTDFAGAASPAAHAGAFLADLAGAFPADLAGMAFPAVAGVVSPAVLAGMAVPDIAGVTSPAVLAGMAIPAVAGAASLAVVEVASSTNRMEVAGTLSVRGSRSTCDCLSPDDFVTESDVVVLPDGVELGNPNRRGVTYDEGCTVSCCRKPEGPGLGMLGWTSGW